MGDDSFFSAHAGIRMVLPYMLFTAGAKGIPMAQGYIKGMDGYFFKPRRLSPKG